MHRLLIAIAALGLAGCATGDPNRPYSNTGFVMIDGATPAVQVDALDVREARQNGGLWETYKRAWSDHPWYTGAAHAGAIAAGYLVGDKQGWWGSSRGSGSSANSSTAGRDSNIINVRGDGNVFTFRGDDNISDNVFGE